MHISLFLSGKIWQWFQWCKKKWTKAGIHWHAPFYYDIRFKDTFAIWEFHWKSSTFLKLIFWPRNGNIDQFWGLNMKVHHSRFPKPNFIFMIHHCDVINRPIYKGFSKMNLTHHSLCFHSIRISFWNSSTTG